jgi:uncharacterized protein
MGERMTIQARATQHAAAWLLALVLLAAAAGPASAQSLDELRSQGAVGERYDGYAVVRASGASSQVQSFVANVNAQRRAIYQQRAKQQNVPADQVGRVYAKQLFERAPAGTWFLDANGKWVRK